MAHEPKKPFLTTLPGIFTGVAGVIGATASLIAALNGIGIFDAGEQPPAPSASEANRSLGQELARTKIAYLSDEAGTCDIHVVDADGTNRKQVTRSAGIDLRPDWSPNGRNLAFANNEDGDFDLYVVDAVTGRQRLLLDTSADEKGPTWSPDGTQIAFSSTLDGDSEIWLIDSRGNQEPEKLTDENATSVSPDWSPDVDAIAFASNRDGQFDIFVVNTEGGLPQNITGKAFDPSPAHEFDPAWSSDGEEISFDGRQGEGAFDIYVMDPDGSDLRNLTAHSANDHRSSWSPDDSRIMFGSDRRVPADDTQRGCSIDTRQMDLFTMQSDGSHVKRFLGTEADDSSPAWGPMP